MLEQLPLLWIYWDPSPDLTIIPYLNLPLRWYGILFSLGLLAASMIFLPLLREKLRSLGCPDSEVGTRAFNYMDRLMWFAVSGIIVGARLGHVFFYDWNYYRQHLYEIPKVWQGGLASHGGTIGLLLALFLYTHLHRKERPSISFIALCDLLAIPAAFAVTCIRIGNFFNQEIIGLPSNLPWAVLFGHPADHTSALPRHPVQLYEAAAYMLTFFILSIIWKCRKETLPEGKLTGWMFVLIFGSRFLLEFLKHPLGSVLDQSILQTGQLLSIPFIVAGVLLLVARKSGNLEATQNTKKKRLS